MYRKWTIEKRFLEQQRRVTLIAYTTSLLLFPLVETPSKEYLHFVNKPCCRFPHRSYSRIDPEPTMQPNRTETTNYVQPVLQPIYCTFLDC